ncbi:amino acid deaminase/aldolase [Nannocystis radixulma]|uniref:Amino acid deaminase/aldolase n=1 Tax=Nannocystis radixulma TaxID=2995305 RepID=A0ABT5BGB4_9BACT|nr:amino acid deaminase/aldolase [Nannocystis radixulma]MDC0669087.1 amino acid deaminase/aldolase [Nannocystis radixulma]MDC0673160.1 amino acid deaminase/aldolase [Nannocystis radixulma]
MTYAELRAALRHEHLPLAYCDLDLLAANARSLVERAGSLPIRIASKSVRCREILRRVQALSPVFQGILCYSAGEAAHLAADGFKDLVVAYPTVDRHDLDLACTAIAGGAEICLMVDDPAQLPFLSEAAGRAAVTLPVAIDLDMSSTLPGLHFGVRRSPVVAVDGAVALADAIAGTAHLRLDGLMGYEAQLAGLQDLVPGQRLKSAAVRALKRRSQPEVFARRAAVVAAIKARGHALRFVNGGGTGSLDLTRTDPSVTELAAGSGLYGPTLFDGYDSFRPQPAAGFALPIVRRPTPAIYTCFGGGYIASGSPGRDRQPTPYLPAGAGLLANEGCGEVQTPVTYSGPEILGIGDPIFFRHAKAGELCEHFPELVLLAGAAVVGRVPTYRGDGCCFV